MSKIRPRIRHPVENIKADINDNETWNTCYRCLKNWKSKPAIEGLLHRTVLCSECGAKRSRRNKAKKANTPERA